MIYKHFKTAVSAEVAYYQRIQTLRYYLLRNLLLYYSIPFHVVYMVALFNYVLGETKARFVKKPTRGH